MKVKEISLEDALILCKKEENHFFDKKAVNVSGINVQKIAVALANADGGEFLVGIADEKDEPTIEKRWHGASKIEDFNPHLQALSEINPTLDFSCEFLLCKEMYGYVLQIRIEKSASVHETAGKLVYLRLGAQSLKITDTQRIMELKFAKGATSFEDTITPNVRLENLTESGEIKNFLSGFSPKTDPLEYIINENLADNKTFEPRIAGILLFHDNPSSFVPRKCAVKIARYETKEDDPERDYLKENLTIEGPLYKLIHKTVDKITDIMSSIKIWTSEGLRNVSYPPEAVWEIVVNAIIHRDYSISDDVHIYIFNNRIEVLSPGKLPGYVTVNNILDSRYSRNTKIVRTLNRYREAPNKDLGEGLNTAFQKMKEWKLKNPEVHEENNYVKVVIPHIPLAKPSELIIKFLENNSTITNRQARDITGIKSENAIKMEFYKLRDEGIIERVPGLEGPVSAWKLVKL